MASEVEIAWAAGFIDGEGCIHVSKRRAGWQRNGKGARFWSRGRRELCLDAVQTSKAPLEYLASILGGTVLGPYKKKGHNRADIWQWRIREGHARRALLLLRPYLRLKAQRATDALNGLIPDNSRGKTAQVASGDETEHEQNELLLW